MGELHYPTPMRIFLHSLLHFAAVRFDSPLHDEAVRFDYLLHLAAVRSDFPLHDAVGNHISSVAKCSGKIGIPAA
jgi:hypothetical protein